MKWISVEDRLPEMDSEKLIMFTDGNGVYFGKYYERNSFSGEPLFVIESNNGHIFKDCEVTHWMPLPTAPELHFP